MRAKAFLAVPFAVFSFQGLFSHAADEPPSELPEITQDDLEIIASQLTSLAKSGALKEIAGQVDAASDEVDMDSVEKALGMLGSFLSSPASRDLLSDIQRDPESLLRELLMTDGGEDDEGLKAVLLYFLSLRRVLNENPYLRNQVTELIHQNAESLLTANSFGEALGKIAASTVFKDLREEVEEDMQSKAGYLPLPDLGDDMSR